MGYANHYDHFLERMKRIDDHQVDFAMSLYYDPEFVRAFLGYYDIPDEYERVAVAIDDTPDCPHIVLARDGGFVTCLGRGMSIRGLFRIPHVKIDGHHKLHGALRDTQRRSEKEGWNVGHMRTFIRRKNLSLSRRDFARLEALQPLLIDRAVRITKDYPYSLDRDRRILTTRLGKKVRRLNARQETDVRNYWQDFFYMHHLSVLAATGTEQLTAVVDVKGMEALFGELAWWTWREAMFGPCLRAMWCAGRMGKVLCDFLLEWTRAAGTPEDIHCGLACLMTIALRHPEHYRRIERMLRGWRDGIKQIPKAQRTIRQDYQQSTAALALNLLTQPEAAEKLFIHRTAINYAYFLDNHELGIDGPLGSPLDLEPMQALAFATLETIDIREQLDEVALIFAAAPLVARAEAADLYAPRELTAHFPDWVPEYGITLFYNHAEQRRVSAPVSVEQTPGRNDPCHCGSGRKYKRCCLPQEA